MTRRIYAIRIEARRDTLCPAPARPASAWGLHVTKAELVDELARVAELTRKHSEVVVGAVFESIRDALQRGDRIELRGFGSFSLRRRTGRQGRNPRTGAVVAVPPRSFPHFKPGKDLRELINRR